MADFTPTWTNWTDPGPFRFWAQKVLPLVYDDSLSYYEVLCKVVAYLNTTIQNVAALGGNVEGLRDAYEQLQQFVNDYFDNLDVQQEINAKLDEMAETGALTTLIEPFVNAQISNDVFRWLDLNIKPTTPAIDASLTVSGAGADAKVVGDRLAELSTELSDVTDGFEETTNGIVDALFSEYDSLTWGQGGINANTGVNANATNRIRSANFQQYTNAKLIHVICPAGYKIGIREFTEPSVPQQNYWSRSVPTGSNFLEENISFIPVPGYAYRYVIAKTDDTDILPADAPSGFKVQIVSDNLGEVNDLVQSVSASLETLADRVEEDGELTDETIDVIVSALDPSADALTWTQGGINASSGANSTDTTRIRSSGFQNYNTATMVHVTCPEGYKIGIREFDSDALPQTNHFVGTIPAGAVTFVTRDISFNPTANHYYRFVIAKTDDGDILPENVPAGFAVTYVPENNEVGVFKSMFSTNVGNCGILCAKEHNFVDGSSPTYEYFLIGDPATNKVYYTKDFTTKTELFTFGDRLGYWSFGIDSANNIICCKQAEYLADTLAHDDSLRINPIVYLYSENYRVPHTVNFGNGLKPCGWLSSVGFICLNNGDCLIAEYTRPVVETANIWKITGDPSTASSWSVKKSFNLSGSGTGFKHIHCVQQDFYTGVCYFGTGDDDTSSHVYYSLDNGSTWTAGKENNEKYCRLLNLIFTPDWVYWSTDSNKEHYHFVFKAARNSNGVIDFDNIIDLIEIPLVSGMATYGCAYFPEYEALLLLERCDGAKYTEAPVRVYDIATNQLQTALTLHSINPQGDFLGFRTRFAQWYPKHGEVNLSWHLRGTSIGSTGFNQNKMFGNQSSTGDTTRTINNACLKLTKDSGVYRLVMDTYYI